MTVVAFDPLSDPDADARLGVARLGFDELLAASDVVSLHLPLTPATPRPLRPRDLRADAARLDPAQHRRAAASSSRPTCTRASPRGHLAGAGLDVLNSEPPEPGNPLLTLAQRRRQPPPRRDRHQGDGRHGRAGRLGASPP